MQGGCVWSEGMRGGCVWSVCVWSEGMRGGCVQSEGTREGVCGVRA